MVQWLNKCILESDLISFPHLCWDILLNIGANLPRFRYFTWENGENHRNVLRTTWAH